MHINLSPEMEKYLQTKVGTGFYSNASEVVRDAIRRMRAEDEKLEALRAAVRVGDEQLERGEGIAYTPERLDKITDEVFARGVAARSPAAMPHPDPALILSPQAEDDFADILRYTVEN
ncbi:type II toxin-antitoxin system ParD family antitoxin [Methylococcus sp. ANG]|uniref:type II toxin-antitoxin system ParD family antitoxin n=1 Tax=Methylococcus sp. ANG TaxID=3231903 RepID=UPI0034591BD2